MSLKGRYINDRRFQDIPGEGVTEVNNGEGMVQLKPNISAITMMPVRRREKKTKNNKDTIIMASIIVSAFCAGCTFIGLFLIPRLCFPVFVGSITWLVFVLWNNKIYIYRCGKDTNEKQISGHIL